MIKIKNEEIFEKVDEIKSIEAFESDNNKTFFKGSGENLKNYRIYGENGNNLFNDKELEIGGLNVINGEEIVDTTTIRSPFIKGFSNYRYYLTLFNDEYKIENIYYYNYNYLFLGKIEVNSNYTNFVPISSTLFIRITFKKKDETQNISTLDLENKVMLSKGKAALSYEPYGESVGDRTGNLFDETNGVVTDIYIRNDGTTAVGSNGDKFICNRINVLPNSTYTFSWQQMILGTASNTPYIRVSSYDANNNFLVRDLIQADVYPNKTCSITTLNNAAFWDIRVDDVSSKRGQHLEEVMLNLGDTPLPYEPYGYKVPVTVEGKNLLQNTATSQTIDGMTFTVNSDGSVTCNGQVSATTPYVVCFVNLNVFLRPGNYYLSGNTFIGSPNSCKLDLVDLQSSEWLATCYSPGSVLFNISDNKNVYCRIVCYANFSCNNLTFYPMVRKADIEDDTYEPYHTPITTNIYLDAPLCKVNGEEEYIDFLTQKVHRIQKNLLPNNTQLPTTINGVKWSIRESDGAIMAERVSPSESPSDLVYTSSFIAPANQIFVLKLFYEGEEPSATTYSANVIYNNIDHWDSNGNSSGIYRFETDTEMSVILRVSSEYNGIAIFAPIISNYNYNEFFNYTPYIQNTEQSIILPAISTFSDTNILSVNTKVKPSKIWGRISEPRDILYVKDNLGNVLFSKYHEIEDEPPLSYKAKKAGFLTDYRIYGQTSRNLFDGELAQGYYNVTAGSSNDLISSTLRVAGTSFIPVSTGDTITVTYESTIGITKYLLYYYNNNKEIIKAVGWYINGSTFTIPNNASFIRVIWGAKEVWSSEYGYITLLISDISNIMLNAGSTPLPYEPYGESVGDRTGNLFDYSTITTGYRIYWSDGGAYADKTAIMSDYISVITGAYSINHPVGIICYDSDKNYIGMRYNNSYQKGHHVAAITSFTITDECRYIRMLTYANELYPASITENTMLNTGSTALPYEPYGYKVPVTVSNGTDTLTTPIYLPEQIKKVGDEAEYIDYGTQKQHRVRKNLLQNTATSQTVNGVTFTVNSDGSITCNGTCVNNIAVLHIRSSATFDDETIQYTLTGCPAGGEYNSTYALEYTNSINQTKPDVGNGVSFTPYRKASYPYAMVRIIIFVGYTCDNLTFYPMIRKANIEDDTYEPYFENVDLDVTLPALPTLTGTNVLSVGTEVQPSKINIKGKIKGKIYGWHVNPDISDSSNAVTYLKDAIGMTPASMGSTTFDYGSWENAFFMPKPCMLKANGKVDYYLDPNDYTKKLNGTASDISNPNYDGNAMM